jgi:hypothetical protein
VLVYADASVVEALAHEIEVPITQRAVKGFNGVGVNL